jgi:hypothetical protein
MSVAVLGVDNDDVFCELANPPLSSIALATHRIGYEAARMLDRLMAGEKPATQQLLWSPPGAAPRQSSNFPSILDADMAAAVRYISLHVQDDLQVADLLREVHLSRRSLEAAVHQSTRAHARRRDPAGAGRGGQADAHPDGRADGRASRWPRVSATPSNSG